MPHAARAALELDLDGELRGEVEVGLAAALARDVREGLPFPRAVERHDGELDAGEVAAAALLDDGALDALDDARASLRVVEPCAERVAAAGERPRWEEHAGAGGRGGVGVGVDGDVEPFGARGVDHGEGADALAPLGLAHELVVRDLSGHAGLARDADDLGDRVDGTLALVTDVRGVE